MKALLFTDIVDSTLTTERLGDARAAEMWTEHDRRARELMRLHRAREIDRSDGFFLLFDDVADAAGYAMAYHATLPSLGLAARAGLHVGEVILRTNPPQDVALGAKPIEVEGIAKPLASRVMSLAGGGQTLITHAASSALAQRIAARAAIESRGHYRFAGVADPVEIFELSPLDSGAGAAPRDTAKAYRVVQVEGIWRPLREVRQNLPAERNTFVGREAELKRIGAQLESGTRLLTLLGVGGTGKTRLACRYGATSLGEWPGGVYFCDLAEARSVEGIYFAVASALELTLGRTDPAVQIGHAIAGRRRCLVILDNFEQVQRHAAQTLGAWLDRAADAAFLVTSRERLQLAGESVVPIDPLPLAGAAIELFGVRAAARRPDFVIDDGNRRVVAEIVRMLDGLPLAIELAAARIGVLQPVQLLERLKDRFQLLGSAGSVVARQATLRATVDWSWNLLTPWEQAALTQCSVFEGGFTLEAAERVLDISTPAPPILDVVQALLDKCLLRMWLPAEAGRFGINEPYFGMYLSVHEYVREKLHAAGPQAQTAAERRHGAYFAGFGSDTALRALSRHGGVQRRHALALELDNLVVACRRAAQRHDGTVALGCYLAAAAVLELKGPLSSSVELSTLVLAMPGTEPSQRIAALIARARAAQMMGHAEQALDAATRALDEAQRHGDRAQECKALGMLAGLDREQSRMDHARARFERALAIARDIGDTAAEGVALSDMALIHYDLSDIDRALPYFEQALGILRALGDRRSEGVATGNLANVQYEHGHIAEAQTLCAEVCAIGREVGDRLLEGISRGNLGSICNERGLHEEARRHLEEALAIHRDGGHRRHEGIVLDELGQLQQLDGRFDLARSMQEEALAIAREVRNHRDEAGVQSNLGNLARELGQYQEAQAHYEAALAFHRERGDRYAEGMLLNHLGELRRREGRLDEALQALDQGEALLVAVGDPRELAKLLCTRCSVLIDVGRPEEARAALTAAQAAARETNLEPASELGQQIGRTRQRLEAAQSAAS